VYASSSSVYGLNESTPFSESDAVDRPASLYGATKRANELMAGVYARLYQLPVTGLRFFTVYGPWGRPDMAYFSFAKAILSGEPLKLFNHGQMKRDFTYIDDVVQGVLAALDRPAKSEIYNLGNHHAEALEFFVACLEDALGKKALKEYAPMQPGDVVETFADIKRAQQDLGYQPSTRLAQGIPLFVDWFRNYHGINYYPPKNSFA
jgi:UDP-glucuronate 4-epimerase